MSLRSILNLLGSASPVGANNAALHTAVLEPGNWSVTHAPAANTVATISQASPGTGFKNIVTGIGVTFCAGASAPSAVQVTAVLRDGATGAGTIKKNWVLALPATAGAMAGVSRRTYVICTEATAATLEFSAAGGANTIEAVEMEGMVVPI